jgi:uncharacterized membrane protein YphA (DoxX/SURF4 family)
VSLVPPRWIIGLLRIGLGVLFIAAALPKLSDPYAFAKSVSNYHILPLVLERVLALVLPVLELSVGICLVLGILDAGASFLVALLMVVFTAAVGRALARGLDISCGCFDTEGGAKVGLSKIAENLALTAFAFWVWMGDRSFLSLGERLRKASDIE